MTTIVHKVNAAAPRLSDEEPDLMEQEDLDGLSSANFEGWLPWTGDDIVDIRRIVQERLEPRQREIVEAFLTGRTAEEVGVTEKYWRYHLKRAVEFIKKEMGV